MNVTLQRDLEVLKPITFELRPVEIGQRSDGKPVTACVVDWTLSAESEFEAKPTPQTQHALDCLKRLTAERDAAKPRSVSFTEWKDAFSSGRPRRKGADGSAKGDKQALDRAAKALLEQELIAKTKSGRYVLGAA